MKKRVQSRPHREKRFKALQEHKAAQRYGKFLIDKIHEQNSPYRDTRQK